MNNIKIIIANDAIIELKKILYNQNSDKVADEIIDFVNIIKKKYEKML